MGIGAMFKLGEQKARPNVYVRWYNAGGYKSYARPLGVGAALVKSNWGPLETVQTIEASDNDPATLKKLIGSGLAAELLEEAFLGGAVFMHTVRVGNGGEKGKLAISESSAGNVELTTKYPTSRKFEVTLRDALDPSKREIIITEEGRQLESYSYEAGDNEALALTEVLARSAYLDVKKVNDGELPSVVSQPLTGGSDPTVTAEDYTSAMPLLETKFFDSLILDTENTALQASAQAFIRRRIQEGYRTSAVFANDLEDDFNTRIQKAKAFNDFAIVYIGNAVRTTTRMLKGALAAARVMGMMISGSYKSSLTKNTINGGIEVIGELTANQYDEAANNGLMVFSLNTDGIPQIDYGINTLVSIGEDEDEGWKKIRRMRTRYELIDRIVRKVDKAMSNNVDNNADGRQHVITLANGEINQMIEDGGLESGAMVVDPKTPPQGDSAWFTFDNLVDLDGLEKAYLAFGFKY
ncbi:phage tail sheath subtilisin-like domain-containing protein [Lysinibacillus sp. Bpr_S20]|uniref:phage tail sheath subtilisin-like domain-containing protein n=1 Tax=Lysinibacillus sp. Bpr_S20 TaxID=2933964 RepID=UPI002013AECA|nr:phage tail sheath subtilisin-like domain-containing protein [Lysinibacillus sp. Bpr_S20]MCL1701624.1 phage tail sheath protein [Lysinibacillus sp. Bpr_S20]